MRKSDAVDLLKKRLGEIDSGRFVGRAAESVTLDDLAEMIVEDYKANDRKSTRGVENSIRHLKDGLSGPAVEITTDRITRYMRERREAKAAPATIRKELAALRRMFTLAVRARRIPAAPAFPTIEVRNVRQGFFEPDELAAILQHLAPEVAVIVEFLALTGWRRGEALGLRWRNVDFDAGTIRLDPGTTKNDQGRTFPFKRLPALAALLERQREYTARVERENSCVVAAVFHRDGRPIVDFQTSWERARMKAGLPGRHVHDLRRTRVRDLERGGIARSVAMKLTGHKTESVYLRYAIVNEADLGDAVAKLATVDSQKASSGHHLLAKRR